MSSGIIYSKGFQLKPLFDYYINKMLGIFRNKSNKAFLMLISEHLTESGQIHRIQSRWKLQAKDCGAAEISIGFENIVSAFAALATGVGVALLVTAAERVNGQCCCCSNSPRRTWRAILSCVE